MTSVLYLSDKLDLEDYYTYNADCISIPWIPDYEIFTSWYNYEQYYLSHYRKDSTTNFAKIAALKDWLAKNIVPDGMFVVWFDDGSYLDFHNYKALSRFECFVMNLDD